ncbi:Glycoside hydrolase, family 61 [Penicillium camemberti]|uniref:Glycoside hydrolase, family 61 n=1 Tax=Penicillium camemberti (strain FM 013) TaxID=1429867 RepID=A0A0G4PP29_PENC3|nr:Glycoside hydrolase, family 61 [Penicillium camemberti]
MSISKITGLLLSSAAMVAGHGYVSGAVVDGTYHGGFLVNTYNYMEEVPANIGWAEKATDLGFIDGSGYASSDIICHKEATPGAISAEVKAGGEVELQWTEWPESHHGPVITYMANCNGDCSKVDKTTLKFFKIAEAGLIDDSNVPGKWATDELIANNNSATVTIPSAIAAGNYVLRHEIIGLHSAGEENGAQNYPQCLNLKVTGGGSDVPEGVLGTALYKATDPGIKISIYTALDSYEIPGPALYTGAASGSSSGSATTTAAATTAPATTAAPTAASTVSASPIQSSSRHFTRTRTFTPSGTPTPSSAPSSAYESTEAPSTATETATFTEAATSIETATSTVSSAPQVTDEPDTQTASSADSVSITSTASGQSAQSTTPVSGGDDSESSSSASATATAAPTAAASSSASASSGDYSSYLSSLSAEKLLEAIRSTLKWLVSDSKVHARALAH